MSDSWYYCTRANGKVFGPCSSDDLRRSVRTGALAPEDLLWPAGGDPRDAVPAEAALAFPDLGVQDNLPDWLADVAAAETTGPIQRLWRMSEVPDWVAELQRLDALPAPGAAPHPSMAPEDGPPPASAQVDSQVPPSAEPASPRPIGESRDESLQEVYQRAQFALQQWADLEINRDLILNGEPDAIQRDVGIRSIVGLLDRYGPQVVSRFWRHADFVLENRRKYIEAVARADKRSI